MNVFVVDSVEKFENAVIKRPLCVGLQARRRGGGSRGSDEPPLEVNTGGLKTETVDFQLFRF